MLQGLRLASCLSFNAASSGSSSVVLTVVSLKYGGIFFAAGMEKGFSNLLIIHKENSKEINV